MIRNPAGALDDARAMELLSKNLERWMRRRGITQVALAKKAGMLRSTLNTYVTRKSLPRADKLEALATALEVGVEDLLPKVDQDAIRDMVQGEMADAAEPAHSMSASPGRPGYSRLTLRVDLPTRTAMEIIDIVLNAETEAAKTSAPSRAAPAETDQQ